MSEQGAVRVSDAEREQVAERLAAAQGEGRLTLVEYDERVRAAHGAVVRDDLAPLLADLPGSAAPARPAPTRRREGAFPTPAALRPAMPMALPTGLPTGLPCASGRGAVAAWAFASVVNVVIWLAVSVGTASVVYPWWIWVAGPWGLVLALGALGRGVAHPRA